MTIPTEPIGSIPRPLKLLDAIKRYGSSHPRVEPLYDEAVRETIEQFESTGSPVITDGEQRKYHNFATYCVEGLPNTAPDGFKLPFADGHARRWPRLTGGPFRFLMYGYEFLDRAMKYAHVPVKQAVISPSALSLMYPAENLPGYSREKFIEDLLGEHEKELRGCFAKGAHNLALSRFSEQERSQGSPHLPRIGQRFDPQRGCGLRRTAAELVRAPGGEFLRRAGRGTGSHPRAEDHPKIPQARTADIHRSRFTHRSASRKSERNTRPHPGGSAIYPSRTTWHHG